MIEILPQSKSIGSLQVIETYEYYDGPKLFACRNGIGQIYLGLWAGETEVSEFFLLVAMTQDRYRIVRSGGIDLQRAFSLPEFGFLYFCTVQFYDSSTETIALLPEQLNLRMLPDPGEKLDLKTETLPIRFAELALAQKAVAFQREMLGFHLDFGTAYREEAPTKGLGKVLISWQETIDSLGQEISGEPTTRGAIPPGILTATETRVIQAGGGSFALEITAAGAVDLFGKSLIGDAISKFVDLVAVGSDVEELRSLLVEIRPRAVSKYKDFLSSIVESEGSIRLDWTSPNPQRNRSVELDLRTAAGALQIAEQVTSEFGDVIDSQGIFVGVVIPRKTFTAVINGKTYSGRILDSALSAASTVRLNDWYQIKIRETLEVNSTGEERSKYALEEIRPVQVAINLS